MESESVVLEYIEKIIFNVKELKEQMNILDRDNPIVCFRGESRHYGATKLMPSLFRINEGVSLDRELIELLCDYDIPNSLEESQLSKSIAGQHFVEISRLLDITFSVLPSLYFACNNYDEKDGFVYSFVFPESFSPNSEYLNFYYKKIVEEEFLPYSKDFKVITHSYNNERIKLQNGGFILFPGKSFNRIPKEYYNKPIKINAEDKKVIRDQLSKYFNITNATIYPEKDKRKDVISERLNNYKKTTQNDTKKYQTVELEYYLRRIEFEIIVKQSNGATSIDLKRFLRKEKENMLFYVINNFEDKELDFHKENVNLKFTLIQKGIEGENND